MPRRLGTLMLWATCATGYAASVTTFDMGSSPNPVGSGARAMGQGNAFIAVADDATAASWNPGGLSQLERPELSLAVEAIARRETIGSDLYANLETRNTLSLGDLNYASAVLPVFWRKNMVLSLNYLKLYRFDKRTEFPHRPRFHPGDDILRPDGQVSSERDGGFSVLAPAFGIDVTPRLALGITLNLWSHALTGSSRYAQESVWSGVVTEDFDRDGDLSNGASTRLHHALKDDFEVTDGCSVVLGGMYRINKPWTLGVVLKPPFTLELDHARREVVSTEKVKGDLELATPGDTIKESEAELHFPWIIGAGVAWRPSDPLTVSTDVTWSQWSEHTYSENGKETNPVSIQDVSREELDDTYTVRLGAEYLIIRERYTVPLRCGLGYDPSPAVDGVDDYYTVSVGTGLQFRRFMFDLAYEYKWGRDVNGDILRGYDTSEDTRRHRVLASLIVYF